MLNPEMLLGQLLRGGLRRGSGRGRRRRTGVLGGMSTGTKAQLGLGLLGVAIAAYEHYTKQSETSVSPSPSPSPSSSSSRLPPPVPSMPRSSLKPSAAPDSEARASDATLLVQAMVAAAAADGVIDETERAQILSRADQAGFDQETRDFLQRELNHPKSLAVIVKSARPELAIDLYAASCAAIDADTEAEKTYLEALARHLKLGPEVVEDIHRKLESVS